MSRLTTAKRDKMLKTYNKNADSVRGMFRAFREAYIQYNRVSSVLQGEL